MSERDIFDAALAINDPAQRAAYLERTCAGNPRLREHIDGLLSADGQVGSFLESPAVGLAATADHPVTECPGTVIGPYKLLEQIGEGGFGVVFMAEQTRPVRRKVALKVLKPGMDTRQVVARFEAERQALALMDHPNIAKVHDAGTTETGRPYFVMELVKGVSITEFCDRNRLPVRERLELFAHVCQAVQHAHQRGVIHRDIKPANVLVTLHDGVPVVKVIDFGVAKALGQQLTDRTLFTGFAQMVGTPLYMSPEQAEMSGLDVDTRSDIYALGVLLYELLTGSTPFDRDRLRQAGYDEIRRIIREEEPPRPSTRISTLGQAAAAVAAGRQTDPQDLRRQCRKELDWVVMKCLEKDRNRRYETVAALAADVRRFLGDEPVLACPPSAWYRFRKLARRNRRALVMVSALALAALVGVGALAVSTVLVWQANKGLKEAVDRERREAYFQRITVAHHELTDNLGRAEELLGECPEDLRGWEWHYLQRRLRVPPITLPLGPRLSGGKGFDLAFSPDGRFLAVPSGDKDLTVWDASTGEARIFQGHSARALCLAFSPDGHFLLSGGADKSVRLWETETGKEVRHFQGHDGPVHGVAWSPDGRRLASAGRDQTVKLWDATTGALCFTFPASFTRNVLVTLPFSPDGSLLAAPGEQHTVTVWDVNSRREVATLRGHTDQVFSVAFSPDGRRVVTAGWEGSVKVWDLTGGARGVLGPQFSVDDLSHAPWSVALSADGRRLALAGSSVDATVRVYDALSGKNLFTLWGHSARVVSVAFSPDGRRLASGSTDKTVRVWDTATGHEVLTLRGHTDLVGHVRFDPGGRRLASAGDDGTLRVWDATPPEDDPRIRTLRGHAGVVRGVAFSPDGRHLASAGGDQVVRVWDVTPRGEGNAPRGVGSDPRGMGNDVVPQTPGPHSPRPLSPSPREVLALRGHSGPVNSVAFSPDGLRLASAGEDKTVKLWDARTGAEVSALTGFPGGVRCVAFSPHGRRLATSDAAENVQVWDSASGRQLLRPLRGHEGYVNFVAFSHDGKLLATSSVDGTVRLWDATTGKEARAPYRSTTRVMSMALSPGSGLLAWGDADRAVKVWETATGKQLSNFPREHTNYVIALAFSRDGRRLASASCQEVLVWETSTGRKIKRLSGFAGTIKGVAFSPDGRHLAACGGYKTKGEIKIWDATLWDERPPGGGRTPPVSVKRSRGGRPGLAAPRE